MQTKDIDKLPVLRLLKQNRGKWTFFGYETGINTAMPKGTPLKLQLSVMRTLIKQDLVSGCACGCRGDFEITDKGLAYLLEADSNV